MKYRQTLVWINEMRLDATSSGLEAMTISAAQLCRLLFTESFALGFDGIEGLHVSRHSVGIAGGDRLIYERGRGKAERRIRSRSESRKKTGR